ncbi:MAG: LysR family transcriptional regulator [Desulfobacteraceae bacterium]|nr:LysR family transcriptional regulator [Desulfobacteraceae bacterium]
MLNLNHLRIFYHAARNLSFTTAAKDLFITQPAVTAQLKTFESAINMKLFRKRGRGIDLTDQGEILFEYAKKIFAVEKQIEGTIKSMANLEQGTLRLGTTKAYARYLMPYILSSFHASHPRIKIHLNEGSSRDMAHSLISFKNEVAVIAQAGENEKVAYIPYSQEELVVIISVNHHLASRREVSIEELAKEPIIMKENGSGTRRVVSSLFESHGYHPNVLMETSNTEFIKQLVQRGEGFSMVVKASVAQEIEDKKLVSIPISGRKYHLDVSIAYLKDQTLSPPANAFIKSLQSLGPKLTAVSGIGELVGHFLARQQKEEQPHLMKAIHPPK